MSTTHNRPKTMAELGTANRTEIRELAPWMKVTVNVLFVLPIIVLLGYASGLWVPKNDAFDNIVTAGAIFAGIFGLIAINFCIKYLEDRR